MQADACEHEGHARDSVYLTALPVHIFRSIELLRCQRRNHRTCCLRTDIHTHGQTVVKGALQSRRHALVEKPLARPAAQAASPPQAVSRPQSPAATPAQLSSPQPPAATPAHSTAGEHHLRCTQFAPIGLNHRDSEHTYWLLRICQLSVCALLEALWSFLRGLGIVSTAWPALNR